MAWGAQQTITTSTNIANSWTDIQSVALNPRELAVFQLSVNIENTTITDAAEIRVLNSNSGGSTWDDTPVWAMSYTPSSTSAENVSFSISGYPNIKVQAQSAGATDTYDIGGSYKLDGVSA